MDETETVKWTKTTKLLLQRLNKKGKYKWCDDPFLDISVVDISISIRHRILNQRCQIIFFFEANWLEMQFKYQTKLYCYESFRRSLWQRRDDRGVGVRIHVTDNLTENHTDMDTDNLTDTYSTVENIVYDSVLLINWIWIRIIFWKYLLLIVWVIYMQQPNYYNLYLQWLRFFLSE